jgi:hypothetical protein
MKNKIGKRWKDVLEIFGSFLDFFSCERLKAMESQKKNVEMKRKRTQDWNYIIYHLQLHDKYELNQFYDLANTK